mmetsp:Transcript_18709/g.33894  ORF Transcript_18709/g.33894 Transcript_18709/m.33894 type:complete len:296 (-) Transcript_18709:216-1103(-)
MIKLMEVVLPSADLLQAGLRAIQITESVWLVPCTINSADNEYSPLLKPFNIESKQKTRHTWSNDEDEILVRIVDERGPKNWNVIAKELNSQLYGSMPVRQGKQCRERWFNHLNPTLRKGNWRASEDIYILKKQVELGNRWSEIAKGMEGRTENSVKNRWKCMIKKAKRRHPHSTNVIDLIIAEREQKLEDDIVPTDSESETSEGTKLKHPVEYDPIGNSDEVIFNLKSDSLPFNTPRLYQPSEFFPADSSCRATCNMEGFSQYAEFAKHFDVNRSKTPRESDFSPSPSMFIRSPH